MAIKDLIFLKHPTHMELVFNTALETGTQVAVQLGALQGTVSVDWGDGTQDNYTTTGNKTHVYASEGTYLVKIYGKLLRYGIDSGRTNTAKLVAVRRFNIHTTDLSYAFFGAGNLISVPATLPSGITLLNHTFRQCATFNGDLSKWDVSRVTGMNSMFFGAVQFNQPLATWNTSNVEDMNTMFFSASAFNQPLSAWDTSKVKFFSAMFYNAVSFNQPIGNWNTSSATGMTQMFRNARAFNQDISSWAVGTVVAASGMNGMFQDAFAFNQNLSSWVTGLTAQPSNFSLNANATFANNANNLKPFLSDGVTRINT